LQIVDERRQQGIDLFNRGEFFECHEVLEEVWTPERGPRRLFLQAVIHLAVGFHHLRSGNPPGAIGQLRKGLRKLAGYQPEYEGIDTGLLYRQALHVLERIQSGAGVPEFPRIYPSKNTESRSNT
jgi:predicted metal-dependent hydrolase